MIDQRHRVERVFALERHGRVRGLVGKVRSGERLQDSGGDGLLHDGALGVCGRRMECDGVLGAEEW